MFEIIYKVIFEGIYLKSENSFIKFSKEFQYNFKHSKCI